MSRRPQPRRDRRGNKIEKRRDRPAKSPHVASGVSVRRDRTVPVDTRRFRAIANLLLREILEIEQFELGIHLVRATEMSRINWQFLQHEGSTDVITFDYADERAFSERRDLSRPGVQALHGEIFICYDDAVSQSRRFRASWQNEIARYLAHGVLHLLGYDDHAAKDRREMKRQENRLLGELNRAYGETMNFGSDRGRTRSPKPEIRKKSEVRTRRTAASRSNRRRSVA